MKRALVVHYSQSGQLTEIVESILSPLRQSPGIEIVVESLRPKRPYPFPWPLYRFLDVFPESVLMEPPELEPSSFAADVEFDLVILAYTVWYLAPSLPVTAFLKSPAAEVMKGVPVITVVNARDKWLMAQERVKAELARVGARHIDNVALVHQGNPLQHLVTTLRWMWTGKKNAFWVFPPAGVDESVIRSAARFGCAAREALESGEISRGEPILRGLGAVKVDEDAVIQELLAYPNFRFWGRLIHAAGKPGSPQRAPLLLAFSLYLVGMIVAAAPVVVLYKLVLRRFTRARVLELVAHYEEPSGSSTRDSE